MIGSIGGAVSALAKDWLVWSHCREGGQEDPTRSLRVKGRWVEKGKGEKRRGHCEGSENGGWCKNSLKSLSGGRSGEGGCIGKHLSSYRQD